MRFALAHPQVALIAITVGESEEILLGLVTWRIDIHQPKSDLRLDSLQDFGFWGLVWAGVGIWEVRQYFLQL